MISFLCRMLDNVTWNGIRLLQHYLGTMNECQRPWNVPKAIVQRVLKLLQGRSKDAILHAYVWQQTFKIWWACINVLTASTERPCDIRWTVLFFSNVCLACVKIDFERYVDRTLGQTQKLNVFNFLKHARHTLSNTLIWDRASINDIAFHLSLNLDESVTRCC